MAGLGRMHKQRRRAGGCQGGGNLARHMPRLAHAGDDDAPAGRRQQVHSAGKPRVQAGGKRLQPGRLGGKHISGDIKVARQGREGGSHRRCIPAHGGALRSGDRTWCRAASCRGEGVTAMAASRSSKQASGGVVPNRATPQCAKRSGASQPSTSSCPRAGRKSKHACASARRPSRSSSASSLPHRACRCSTSDAA